MEGKIIAKQYVIEKKLGSGAFGQVYECKHQESGKTYAVKLESLESKCPQILTEAKLMTFLSPVTDPETCTGIPHVHHVCSTQAHNLVIMDLLGPSLQSLFDLCNNKFDLKTILMLTLQMLDRLEFLHSHSVIHRDIKPENFVMGQGDSVKGYKLYLVDFGLAKKYIDQKGQHIPYKDNKNLTGTARYASLNTHLGIEQSRRDDLECVGNVLVYLFQGSLPWQNLKAKNKKEKYEKIMDKKLSTPLTKLCLDMPSEFLEFLKYAKCLDFEEAPDYLYLKNLFRKLMDRQNIVFDYEYSWGSLRMDQYHFSDDV